MRMRLVIRMKFGCQSIRAQMKSTATCQNARTSINCCSSIKITHLSLNPNISRCCCFWLEKCERSSTNQCRPILKQWNTVPLNKSSLKTKFLWSSSTILRKLPTIWKWKIWRQWCLAFRGSALNHLRSRCCMKPSNDSWMSAIYVLRVSLFLTFTSVDNCNIKTFFRFPDADVCPIDALLPFTMVRYFHRHRDEYFSVDILPHIIKHLGNCQSLSELNQLTRCLEFLYRRMVSPEFLNVYAEKIIQLIDQGQYDSGYLLQVSIPTLRQTVLKPLILVFFRHFPFWAKRNGSRPICQFIGACFFFWETTYQNSIKLNFSKLTMWVCSALRAV